MNHRVSLFLSIIFGAYFLQSCGPKCEQGDFYMELTFVDSTGTQLTPTWDRVYGLGGEGDLVSSDSISRIPINSSQDSTVFFFLRAGSTDRLAFSYSRQVLYDRGDRGYCLTIQGEELSPTTTFDIRSFVFESVGSLGSRDAIYEIQIKI